MKKIRVFETFAGIGAQNKAFKNSKLDYEIVATSDWFIDAILAYDAIHCKKKRVKVPSYEEQIKYLEQFTFSNDSVKPCTNLIKKKPEEIEKLYIANKRVKNLGSITEIHADIIPDHDLLTYSFPCQDLSTGGKTKGMKKGSGTRSGLLWEIERILKELSEQNRLPKYLLMENVKAILAPSNEKDFKMWQNFLRKLGYENEVMVLSGKYFGVPQDRARCFMVSKFREKPHIKEKLKLNLYPEKNIKKFLRMDYTNEVYKKEADEAQLPRTESRERMWKTNKRDINKLTYFNTITCNMDRQNNAGMILYDGPKGDSYRLLTAREAFLLMGFSEKDYENVKELGLSYRKTIKLAGNSIVVPVLEAIFKAMFGDEEKCKK
jgi:DNA (cytosine-5)-methyltransferase 1